jgi:hypothetical protein
MKDRYSLADAGAFKAPFRARLNRIAAQALDQLRFFERADVRGCVYPAAEPGLASGRNGVKTRARFLSP